MMQFRIRYTVACESGIAGLPDEELPGHAAAVAARLRDYARRRWPQAEVEIRVVPENISDPSNYPVILLEGDWCDDILSTLRGAEMMFWSAASWNSAAAS
jgi:hypothetical protein